MTSCPLVLCPYDPSHKIRSSRLPYHLVKCRKNHPEMAKILRVCPYNARHQIPHTEFQQHVAHCADGKNPGNGESAEWKVNRCPVAPDIGKAEERPPCAEDWDLDEEESTPPFIFGDGKSSAGKM
ncbi:gametocyte-specific factor 1 isoform X2 [Callorhinchus milii]|nr:gametocyte-specific factor 1 isoform X2 [Callorhinchus milii]